MMRVRNTNRTRVATIALAALTLTTCVDQRTTGPYEPPGPAKLAAMDIGVDPVVSRSATIAALPGDTEGSFIIPLGGDSLVRSGQAHDVLLTFVHPWCVWEIDASVFDHTTQSWRMIESKGPYFLRICGGMAYPASRRLLSLLGYRDVTPVLNEDGDLLSRGDEIRSACAVVLSYRNDYDFITVRSAAGPSVSVLAFDGRLWMSSLYVDMSLTNWGDSLLVYSTAGKRVASYWLPRKHVSAMACDDRGLIWLHHGGDPAAFTALDSTGQRVCSFNSPSHVDSRMAWAAGRLWLLNGGYGEMLGIDPVASLEAGIPVVTDRFPVPLNWTNGMTSDDSTLLISSGSTIFRYSLNGTLLASWESAVAPAGDIGWDGESLWMLHYGSVEARTDATLLSRFRLP